HQQREDCSRPGCTITSNRHYVTELVRMAPEGVVLKKQSGCIASTTSANHNP
ncbi:unnamed protein product, partial [Amoebophrya sp. A120]